MGSDNMTPHDNMQEPLGTISSPGKSQPMAATTAPTGNSPADPGDTATLIAAANAAALPSQPPSHCQQLAPKPRRARKVALIVALVLIAILGAAYVGGAFVFSRVCYPNTTVAGTDLSLMTRQSASTAIASAAKNYHLTITGDGFTWTYRPKDPTKLVDPAAVADAIISSNDPLAWPLHLYEALTTAPEEPADLTLEEADALADRLSPNFDRTALTEQLTAEVDAHNDGKTGTFDAVGAYDPKAGKFTLEQARSNEKLDPAKIERLALGAIATLDGEIAIDGLCRVPLAGGATDAQLNKAIAAANDLIGTDVELTMAGTPVTTLDGAQLAQWITFDDDLKPTLDTGQVDEWVAQLARECLDTVGRERSYTRPDGKKVKVKGGSYGWVSNEKELVKLIEQAVRDKATGELEIPLKQQAHTPSAPGERDWGAYLDIDLAEQRARYYNAKDELVWQSGVITGKPSESPTPTGVYMLNAKDRDSTLIGFDQDKDGEPDYKTPVAYWMPFIGNAVGLHDASWQAAASFKDPRAYTWTGSHGCVNLPPAKAKELFGIIQVGDCVIVHR